MQKRYSFSFVLKFGVWLCLLNGALWLQLIQAQPLNDNKPQQFQDQDPILVKEYMLDGEGRINVFTLAGNIEVTSIPDSRKVRIELYSDRGFSFWPYSSSLENYRITSLKRGNEITTAVEQKSKHKSSLWSGSTTFSYKITVPEAISTTLKTLSGNVVLQNMTGRQIIKTSGGDINISEIQGHVEAYTSGGNININESDGVIFARADGGNISINNTQGEMRLKIHGGKIMSSGLSGSMIAVVNAGDINAQFNHVGEVINLQTNAGSINLVVPRAGGYGLYARGSNVRFDEQGIFKGTYSSRLADGAINGGGIPVNLTANFGNITVELQK